MRGIKKGKKITHALEGGTGRPPLLCIIAKEQKREWVLRLALCDQRERCKFEGLSHKPVNPTHTDLASRKQRWESEINVWPHAALAFWPTRGRNFFSQSNLSPKYTKNKELEFRV